MGGALPSACVRMRHCLSAMHSLSGMYRRCPLGLLPASAAFVCTSGTACVLWERQTAACLFTTGTIWQAQKGFGDKTQPEMPNGAPLQTDARCPPLSPPFRHVPRCAGPGGAGRDDALPARVGFSGAQPRGASHPLPAAGSGGGSCQWVPRGA